MTVARLRARPVIVSSLSRTGSTLLLRALNASPSLAVWGEHNAALLGVLDARRRVRAASQLDRGRDGRQAVLDQEAVIDRWVPWVSPFDHEEFDEVVRDFLISLFSRDLAEGVRWGFKEIRYREQDLRQLREVFPGADFVFLVRELRAQVRSRSQAFRDPAGITSPAGRRRLEQRVARFVADWHDRYEGYRRFVDDFPDDSVTLAYEGLDSSVLSGLFRVLRVEQPPLEMLDQVLQHNVGGRLSLPKGRKWKADALAVLDDVVDRAVADDARAAELHRYFADRAPARPEDASGPRCTVPR